MTPDVSVVIISFNDVARLPRAIASIQRQTLRNLEIIVVDDASVDGTEAVVRAIAADDPRVRYERLASNSGGCSAPRNRGMELARAPWLMFCDSDDEYERHACKNLLEVAERTDADVVCGTAERVDVNSGKVRRWRPEVHEVEQVADGLAGLPGLLYDTISVNKLYRASHLAAQGLRFPEGLLFEDQLFTLQAMATAARIATIPQVVYRWHVDRLSEEPSITQRRNEARNVESRIEVNRQIDRFLDERGLAEIRRVKDLKFLRHDLYLYLSSMLEVDDETAALLMDRLVPYVEQVDLLRAWEVRPMLRVAIYHLLARDVEGVRAAMRFVRWASVVDVPVRAVDDRTYWGCEHLDGGPSIGGIESDRWLDITSLHLLDMPFTQRRYLHRLESFSTSGGQVLATGSSIDYDGVLGGTTSVDLRMLVGGDRTVVSVPVVWTGRDGPRLTWRAEGPATPELARALRATDRGTVAIAVRHASHVNVTGVRSSEQAAPRVRLAFPGRRTLTGPDALQIGPHENGAVGWRAVRTAAWRDRLAAVRDGWFRIPGTTRLARLLALVRRDALPAVAARLGRLLPMRDLVLIDGGGRAPDPNVRALSDELAERHPATAQVWTYASDPGLLPHGVMSVRVGTVRHAWLSARARLRIDRGVEASPIGAPARCIVLAACAQVPVHRVGLDDPSVLVSRAATASVRRRGRQWRVLLAASPVAGEVMAQAHAFRGRQVPVGLPRMDAALRWRAAEGGRDALRQHLDLPPDRVVVLHLPTPRTDGAELLDLDAWADAWADRVYLVLRHQPDISVPTRLRGSVAMLRAQDDIGAWVGAAHLVVSDYSSWIGDAVLADRPVILFQPDRETYVNRTHGLYAGLEAVGPVVDSQPDLHLAVEEWLADPQAWDARHGPKRRDWGARWCGPADGESAARAVTAVLR